MRSRSLVAALPNPNDGWQNRCIRAERFRQPSYPRSNGLLIRVSSDRLANPIEALPRECFRSLLTNVLGLIVASPGRDLITLGRNESRVGRGVVTQAAGWLSDFPFRWGMQCKVWFSVRSCYASKWPCAQGGKRYPRLILPLNRGTQCYKRSMAGC